MLNCQGLTGKLLQINQRIYLLKISWKKLEDGTQNYLVFQPINRYFKVITNTDYVSSWKSKGLSDESIKPPNTSDNSLTPALIYYGTKMRVKFNGSCLQQPRLSDTHGTIVNIYIAYELSASSSHSDDPMLKNCLFGAVTFTKNADINKYGYSGYGIALDRKSSFSFPSGGFGENVIVFVVDMSSSAHIDNKKKYILLLGKGPTQGLDHTITAEKMYSINFTVIKKKFSIITGQIVAYFSMVQKFKNLKQKILKL